MRRKILLLFSLLLITFLSSCKSSNNDFSKNKLILVSFTILEDIVKNIAGDEFHVQSVTDPGDEVHGYQPTPSDLVKGSKALVFIENGFNFELWSEKFTSNFDFKVITISDNVRPINIEEDAYMGRPNPHVWVSPKRADIYIDTILALLIDLKPESKNIFEINAEIYKNKISRIDEEFSLFINTLDKNKKFLVSCEGAFSYLAYDYGLTEAYLWPVNAESGVTPKRMANVIKIVNSNNVPAVFCESTVSTEHQLKVAEETGAIFGGNLFVDSLSLDNGPASTYLDLLEYNLNLIKNAYKSDIES